MLFPSIHFHAEEMPGDRVCIRISRYDRHGIRMTLDPSATIRWADHHARERVVHRLRDELEAWVASLDVPF